MATVVLVKREEYASRKRWAWKQKKFTQHQQLRLEKVRQCKDIVNKWDDWSIEGFEWWKSIFNKALKPPPVLTVSEWADLYRKIPSEFAAEPGDWHTDKMECMREVMDACSPSSKWRRVVLVKPTQSGGTEAIVLNTIGFTIDINPRSMLVVFPTLDLAESFSKERLDPMIAITPTLADKVMEIGAVRTGSTVKKKRYPGGFLNLVGANSTTGLSSRPVPIVIMDEVDLCIKNASRQGNPTRLLTSRTTTFFDKKEIFLSSPSNEEDESGIVQMWEDGTQALLETMCPNENCQEYQVMDFDLMDYDAATLPCVKCGQHFPQWKWQNRPKRWTRSNPLHPSTDSFWLTGLDSPWLDWNADLCAEFKEAKRVADMGDDSLLRVFYNTKLARQYRKKGKKVEIDLYHERREIYDCHSIGAEVPDGVVLVTAGVDVQDTYITYDVTGWGRGRESWGIETGEFQGDPRSPTSNVWKQLDDFVFRRLWRYSDGSYIRTRLMFVDSGGHCTEEVYSYCKTRHPRCFPIKGVGGEGHPFIVGGKRREKANAVWLIRLGVDGLKDEFHTRLAIEKQGPGYCHWPQQPNGMPACGYTLEYFEEIVSEQRVLTYSKGFARYTWDKNRTDPNEALDCRIYGRAALEYLKIKLEQIQRDVVKGLTTADIETVEIGLERRITIDTRRKKVSNRYGTTTAKFGSTGTGSSSESSGFGMHRQQQRTTTTTSF